jgi:hypothetical protein
MAQIPRRTNSSKVGSNLENAAANSARRKGVLDARAAKYTKAQAAFRRQRNQILTKPVVRKMGPVVAAIRSEYAQAALAAGGDPAKLRAAKRRAQKAMADALTKSVPRFGELQRQKIAYEKTYGTLVKQDLAVVQADLLPATFGELESAGPKIFMPPYALFEVQSLGLGLLIFDESFVEPQLGNLITNAQYLYDEHGWGFYKKVDIEFILTSVGVKFTVPQTGFLACSAVVENLFNKISCSISDNFGVSHSFLNVDVSLFISIIRSGETTQATRRMLHTGLISHGSDLSFSTSEIPDHQPFTLTFNPRDAFLKGEVIQIMVGSLVQIDTDTDDMEAFVNAVLMWQVKSIGVGMKA